MTEEYGEIRAAIAQDQPFIQDLSIDAGIRFSDYTTKAKATTWKAGIQWAPLPDIRFRGSYDVAIRAPSILEDFTPQSVTNTSVVSVDPCAPTPDGLPATATLAECEHTGVTPAQYGNGRSTSQIIQCPAGQCAVLNGGNPNLSPEKAKTFSVGFTTTPTLVFLTGLTASVDYFKIDVGNIISTIPIDIALNQCLATGNPAFCSLVVRTANGQLFGTTIAGGGYIKGTDVNVATQNVSGVDFQAGYRRNLEDFGVGPNGSLSLFFVGTYTITAKTQTLPSEPVYDCAGLFGNTCTNPLPVWRHLLRVSWLTPWDVTLSAQWRFIGGTSLDSNTKQKALTNNKFDALNATIPAYSYFDINIIWELDPHLELRAGIANIFDKDPPIISDLITGTGTPNTYNTYDLLGRQVYLALTSRF